MNFKIITTFCYQTTVFRQVQDRRDDGDTIVRSVSCLDQSEESDRVNGCSRRSTQSRCGRRAEPGPPGWVDVLARTDPDGSLSAAVVHRGRLHVHMHKHATSVELWDSKWACRRQEVMVTWQRRLFSKCQPKSSMFGKDDSSFSKLHPHPSSSALPPLPHQPELIGFIVFHAKGSGRGHICDPDLHSAFLWQ